MSVLEKENRDRSFLNIDYNSLRGFRVTGLATAEKCLANWKASYLREPSENDSGKWAKIGTAVHVLAEQRLNQIHGKEVDTKAVLDASFVLLQNAPKKELPRYATYLERLERTRGIQLIALEREIEIPLGGPKPVFGQIDCLFKDDNDNYYLLDHKTNRKEETVQEWAHKLQPQLYSFAITKWLNLKKITFIIGRANFDEDIFWEYDAENLEAIGKRGLAIVESIHSAAMTNKWPEKPDKTECLYCKRKDECRSTPYMNQVKGFSFGKYLKVIQ